ncbi:FTR1 family protein [Streptomyces sp. NPDC003691]
MYGTFLFGLGTALTAGLVIAPLLAVAAGTHRARLLRPVLLAVGGTFGSLLVLDQLVESGGRRPTAAADAVLAGMSAVAAAALIGRAVLEVRRAAPQRPLPAGVVVAAAALVTAQGGLAPARFTGGAARAATGTEASVLPLAGVALGVSAAVLLTLAARHGLPRIRPDRRFRAAAAALPALAAAGLLARGTGGLQAAGVLGGDRTPVYDVQSAVPGDSWYGTVLGAATGFSPFPTALQITVWCLYAVPVLLLLLSPIRFGRSVGGAGAEGKTTDGEADSGGSTATPGPGDGRDGARGVGGRTGPDGERLCDGARGTGGRPVGDGS